MRAEVRDCRISELFDIENGDSKKTKTWCRSHEGGVPVYSAASEPYAYVDACMYKGEYLSFSKNGLAGFVRYHDEAFCINGDRAVLAPKKGVIGLDLRYVKVVLEPILRRHRKGRIGDGGKNEYTKLSKQMVEGIDETIPIPVKPDGSFDLTTQVRIADTYDHLERIKESLSEKAKRLKKASVRIEDDGVAFLNVRISDLFVPKNGSSTYTKAWCQEHPGDYPLYSGNTTEAFAYIDQYDYDGTYLTWAKDGLAGYMMLLSGRFALTGHRGILVLKDDAAAGSLSLEYLKSAIEPVFRANIKGRIGEGGKNEYTTLNHDMINSITETIPIPVKPDGSFDLDAQKALVEKQQSIAYVKEQFLERVNRLLNTDVKLTR